MTFERSAEVDLSRLGERLRQERLTRGLSLDDLSARSDVSRGMLSAVERGEKAPTILVLGRIASGLGTSIGRLLGEERVSRVIVRRSADQEVARDASGWERRTLSPILPGVELELLRMQIEPGVDAGAASPHGAGSREYLAVEQGTLLLTLDDVPYTLQAGDSIYFAGDRVHRFANPADDTCILYLAMSVSDVAPESASLHRSVARVVADAAQL